MEEQSRGRKGTGMRSEQHGLSQGGQGTRAPFRSTAWGPTEGQWLLTQSSPHLWVFAG